jgi:hypothetical protein
MSDLNNSSSPAVTNPYAYIAEVVGHLKGDKMGTLEVIVQKGASAGTKVSNSAAIPAKYLPPFFGSTPYEAMDGNNRVSSSSQASYGMWFVPPDIGTKVVVIFVEGLTSECFWIGCVPGPGANHMVPAIAASKNAELLPQEQVKLGTNEVPVLEANRRLEGQRTDSIDKAKRPMHPFALRLATQGLLKDPIRGITSSGARRSQISSVYGISTPGPPVVNGKKFKVGPDKNKFDIYTEREGGTQFVMDDGEISKDEKTGKIGITDELMRIRTRTGHQILLHNSSDLIYIANSRGTAWLEFTSDGKIDIFAADSISIHSEEDFNFRADRDINFEAGRNFNMVALSEIHMEATANIEGFAGLDVNWSAKSHFNASALGRIRLTTLTNPISALNSGIDLYSLTGNINMYATTDFKMQSLLGMNMRSGKGLSVISGATTTIKTVGAFSVDTGGANYITAVGANVLTAATHYERAALIDMNGPTPPPTNATAAADLAVVLEALTLLPEAATKVSVLDTFVLPYREADKNATADMQKGWENNNYYRQPDIRSIMTRVPTHEPWDHHESIDPTRFTPTKLDRGA